MTKLSKQDSKESRFETKNVSVCVGCERCQAYIEVKSLINLGGKFYNYIDIEFGQLSLSLSHFHHIHTYLVQILSHEPFHEELP